RGGRYQGGQHGDARGAARSHRHFGTGSRGGGAQTAGASALLRARSGRPGARPPGVPRKRLGRLSLGSLSGPPIVWPSAAPKISWLRCTIGTMKTLASIVLCATALFAAALFAAAPEEFATSAGTLQIIPIQHASLLIKAGGKVLYVDPAQGVYDGLP